MTAAAGAIPAPQDRPRRRRRAMRVLLVDDRDRLLLFRDSDLGLSPVTRWWITPGGGVEPGESDPAAAVRELAEETGVVVREDELVGPLATRTVVHGYSDVVTTQDEAFWFVGVAAFDVDTSAHTELEQLTMTEHRWWSRSDLQATREQVWPAGILDLWEIALDAVDRGRPPQERHLGTVEESTVPV